MYFEARKEREEEEEEEEEEEDALHYLLMSIRVYYFPPLELSCRITLSHIALDSSLGRSTWSLIMQEISSSTYLWTGIHPRKHSNGSCLV